MWGNATGSEIMRQIAAPMMGGMITVTLLTLLVLPSAYRLFQVGLGLHMRLVLCALGGRDVLVLPAPYPPRSSQRLSSTEPPAYDVRAAQADRLRRATGALLCALGAGTVIGRMTNAPGPALSVTLTAINSFFGPGPESCSDSRSDSCTQQMKRRLRYRCRFWPSSAQASLSIAVTPGDVRAASPPCSRGLR